MAIKPARNPRVGHERHRTEAKLTDHLPESAQVAPNESARQQSLSQDVVCESNSEQIPTLPELSRLLRLHAYQSRRCRQTQQQLYSVHIAAARTARLIQTARTVQRTLAECIRCEDKHSFVNLFNAFHGTLSDRSEYPQDSAASDLTASETSAGYPKSVVDSLATEARASLLELLTKTRHDGGFVADRLTALTHKELIALLPEKGLSKSSDSVFGSSPRTSSRTSAHLGFVVDGQTELLSSLEYSSPLETLIHSVRGISGCSLEDDHVATDVWATVCARLISEQKPGSEKIVPAVIDAWASSSAWPGKDRLAVWIADTLQNGSLLLDLPNKQSFRLRVQGRPETPAEDELRSETFYADAVHSLLCLLSDPHGASVIPEAALKLCQAICRKLHFSPGHQHAFPNFVITRWLFSSFLPDAVMLPEASTLL